MKENMKNEAYKRLALLGIYSPVLKDFAVNNIVYCSNQTRIGEQSYGILYRIETMPQIEEMIRKAESERNIMVYHAILSELNFGTILNLLFVSPYEEEWLSDKWDIEKHRTVAYCINLTVPDWSKVGTIWVRESGGGLIRTN